MIRIERVSPEQMLRNHAEYRRKHATAEPAPKVLNLGPALALDEPDTLQWRGAEFFVRLISYHEGLKLQRASLTLERYAGIPATLEVVDEMATWLSDTQALFRSFLEPLPVETLFVDATPQEVGDLLGFFCACLMKQAVRASKVKAPRPHPTTSMH